MIIACSCSRSRMKLVAYTTKCIVSKKVNKCSELGNCAPKHATIKLFRCANICFIYIGTLGLQVPFFRMHGQLCIPNSFLFYSILYIAPMKKHPVHCTGCSQCADRPVSSVLRVTYPSTQRSTVPLSSRHSNPPDLTSLVVPALILYLTSLPIDAPGLKLPPMDSPMYLRPLRWTLAQRFLFSGCLNFSCLCRR